MGVTPNMKPISLLGFRSFGLKNLQKIPKKTVNKILFTVDVFKDQKHGEPAENQRLCRITSNATLCVEVVTP